MTKYAKPPKPTTFSPEPAQTSETGTPETPPGLILEKSNQSEQTAPSNELATVKANIDQLLEYVAKEYVAK